MTPRKRVGAGTSRQGCDDLTVTEAGFDAWAQPSWRKPAKQDGCAGVPERAICAAVESWPAFAQLEPDTAAWGNSLLYQHGVGLAFLATIRPDGRPRVHPMCPLIADDGLFAFIVPSPKQRDLRRRGAYAMHSFPCPANEDAFYLAGEAAVVSDERLRGTLARQFVSEREAIGVAAPSKDDLLFEFGIESCLLTRTTGHGDPAPAHTIWHAS